MGNSSIDGHIEIKLALDWNLYPARQELHLNQGEKYGRLIITNFLSNEPAIFEPDDVPVLYIVRENQDYITLNPEDITGNVLTFDLPIWVTEVPGKHAMQITVTSKTNPKSRLSSTVIVTDVHGMKQLPLVGTIALGIPFLSDENIEKYIAVPEEISADFCVRCKDDSMINAKIFAGDIVYIRQQNFVAYGQIAAVLVGGGEVMLRKVKLFKDHITLEAENSKYQSMIFRDKDMEKVKVLGEVVAFTSAAN